jgi:hypothetical protein
MVGKGRYLQNLCKTKKEMVEKTKPKYSKKLPKKNIAELHSVAR